ncbi:MAG: BMP family ABC transporter substrate-binding protein [bacterium]|jgi:basic membrane protein A|nr:BMP family ABC transporter substrate-binding protein [bacterium]
MRNYLNLFAIVLALSLGGCSSSDTPPVPEPGDKPFQVIMITDVGGLGDHGFNDAGWAGCQEAQRRLLERGQACEIKVIESREQTDFAENLSLAAERADVVISLGFLITDAVTQVAPQYPDKAFILADGLVEQPNVASILFAEEEGGFLAGLLASFVTHTDTLAVLPGMDIPPVLAFAAGYKAGALTGAKLQNKKITVLSSTIGSFTDPVKAKSLSLQLISQKADVLFQLAGISGLGVIEAVKESPDRCFAIGVDIDQDAIAPGKVLTSVLKKNDRVVADQIVAVADDTFSGGVHRVGLKEEYLGLTEMPHTKHLVPQTAWPALEGAKTLIASGQIQIPRTEEALASFVPPVEQIQAP